jgi:putative addiction module component (TIGR02574 family)
VNRRQARGSGAARRGAAIRAVAGIVPPARIWTYERTSRLLQAALELAPRERAELVDAIAASLDGFDLGDEWEEEIRKRIEDVDSGQVQPIAGADVLSRAEQRQRAR